MKIIQNFQDLIIFYVILILTQIQFPFSFKSISFFSVWGEKICRWKKQTNMDIFNSQLLRKAEWQNISHVRGLVQQTGGKNKCVGIDLK